ncbi:hypothetical protein HNW77_08300 [Komagataeibacter sp. AV436]|uniref:Uncharacterized protein n=1 Tax=Komagataeibacter melomenusus TaxID=2766578 RepID=A0ABX2ADL8_9PROT|nr:hypothetical protein [Komagataeibacter melomenusus]MBV1830686.1 hypothetical protein [Komagataeibacter melomenusus]NPC66390.1 hypothetical protein [Komagataeibacter melomenusus]
MNDAPALLLVLPGEMNKALEMYGASIISDSDAPEMHKAIETMLDMMPPKI